MSGEKAKENSPAALSLSVLAAARASLSLEFPAGIFVSSFQIVSVKQNHMKQS